MAYVFEPALLPSLPVVGTDALFPVHRAFCVGRNYADHAKEMGHQVDREAPFYFMKSAHHVKLATGDIPMPTRTANYHHEVEAVVGLKSGGSNIRAEDALEHVFGYGVGLDMTRRDLQSASKAKQRPWTTGKDVEWSGLSSALTPASPATTCASGRIELRVDGEIRQQGDMSDHIWSLPDIIADLSTLYRLEPGDLIFMGTPAGVGAVEAGSRLEGVAEGLGSFDFRLV